jgi:hypothetical protein
MVRQYIVALRDSRIYADAARPGRNIRMYKDQFVSGDELQISDTNPSNRDLGSHSDTERTSNNDAPFLENHYKEEWEAVRLKEVPTWVPAQAQEPGSTVDQLSPGISRADLNGYDFPN